MPRWFGYLLAFLVAVGIPPFLVLSNLYVFMTPGYIEYEYNKPDFPKAARFSDAERQTYSIASLEYVRGNLSFQEFKALGVYNDREIKHMEDVHNLVATAMAFHTNDGAVMLIALIALIWFGKTRALAARSLVAGGILTIVLFGAIGIFAAGAFDTFFVDFHRMFFEGTSWLFLYTDSLIQFYPEQFWFDTSLYLAALTVIEAFIVGFVGLFWLRHLAHAPEPAPVSKPIPSQAARRK